MKILVPLFSVTAGVALLQAGLALGQETAGGGSARTFKSPGSKARDSVRPLFIEFTPASRDNAATMEEDLNVMSRLLDKALDQGLGEESPPVRLNLPLYYTGTSRSVRALYLEDFGALFMIKVNFPVVVPAKVEARKGANAASSEWDQVKLELSEDEDDEAYAARLEPARAEGDSSQIDSLKKVLLHSLTNAANIRALKPDEFVALSVFGSELSGVQIMRTTAAAGNPVGPAPASAPSNSKKKSKAGSGEASGEPGEPSSVAVAPRPGAPADLSLTDARPAQVSSRTVFKNSKAGPQGTVLNLRVSKADVDAFAKGEMNLETFKSKAVFNSYIGNGHGILSINSWAGSARGK